MQGPRAITARSERLARMEGRAQRVTDTGTKVPSEARRVQKGSERGRYCGKMCQAPRIAVTRIAVILVNNGGDGSTAVLRSCSSVNHSFLAPVNPFPVLPQSLRPGRGSICLRGTTVVSYGYEVQPQYLQYCCISFQ